MVIQGESIAAITLFLGAVPMFLGTLLGFAAPKIFDAIFGGSDNKILGALGDILPGLGHILGSGGAPTGDDILADNEELRKFFASLGVLNEDTDREFEGLRGRASDIEGRRASNLRQTGITPAGISEIEGLEFLQGLVDQFADVDPTIGAAALGLKDQERLVAQQLAMKQGLAGMQGNAAMGLSQMLIPAQQQFASGVGGGLADILAGQGNQDVIMQYLQQMFSAGNDQVEFQPQPGGFSGNPWEEFLTQFGGGNG